ncbi:hypothetical protein R9J51_18315 [Novosphingobium rhizosphaerae]
MDMLAATHSVRDAIERAEKMANTSITQVLVGCAGRGWPVPPRKWKWKSADGGSRTTISRTCWWPRAT